MSVKSQSTNGSVAFLGWARYKTQPNEKFHDVAKLLLCEIWNSSACRVSRATLFGPPMIVLTTNFEKRPKRPMYRRYPTNPEDRAAFQTGIEAAKLFRIEQKDSEIDVILWCKNFLSMHPKDYNFHEQVYWLCGFKLGLMQPQGN